METTFIVNFSYSTLCRSDTFILHNVENLSIAEGTLMTPTRNRGELESSIMKVLWAATAPLTAKEVQDAFTENTPAITTLITVLDRMKAKGDVQKHSVSGKSYTFSPTRTQSEHITAVMSSALSSADDAGAALMHFVGSLSDEDRDFLRHAIDPTKP
jgi:predicted transcriptional regulator